MSNWNGFQFNRFSDDLPDDDIEIIEVQYAQEITNPLEIIDPYVDAAKLVNTEGELFTLLSQFWNDAYKAGFKDSILTSAMDKIDQLTNFDQMMAVQFNEEYDEED